MDGSRVFVGYMWVAVALGAVLSLVGCKQEGPPRVAPPADPPAATSEPETAGPTEKTPVKGAVLQGQAFDSDGDGKVDTWRKLDQSTGQMIEGKDTDGDGVADTWGDVKTSNEPPPGILLDNTDEPLKPLDGPPPPPPVAPPVGE
jgi:hypothetical protein